jgi:His/Glu/Gln/Arg/opine family amino acid ABC transporter permease subunit
MEFDPLYMLQKVLPKLLEAIPTTLSLLLVCGIIGNLMALPVALARISANPLLRYPAYGYILFMRGTPLLVQIYLIYYGLGQVFADSWLRQSFLWSYLREGYWYAVLALSLNTAGYTGEILRGAIQAVPYGQIEAAKAHGMSKWLTLWRITLPQAIRICLPTMSGETILLLKATSLASVVTVYDILGTANYIRAQSFRVYEALIGAAIVYIILVFILTRGLYWLERVMNKDRAALGSIKKPA